LGSDSGGGIIKNLKNKIPMNTTTLKLEPAIAYESVQLPDGRLPLLSPMSIIAGRLAVQFGARYLEK
jgi:hypothetical protein